MTDQPEEVRYLIIRTEGAEFVGFYTGTSSTGNKYKYTIEVKDLKYDESVEKVFYGGEPPSSVSVKQGEAKGFFGSKPNEEAILEWVRSSINDFSKVVHTEAAEETESATQTENVAETETQIETEAEPKDPKEAALKKAQDLLDGDFGFSATDLERYLVEYEGVSTENAKYAVENCEADWKQEALECAIGYEGIGFSYLNMRDTMVMNHGFTKEEATYAVDHCFIDWKQEALVHIQVMMEYEPEVYESYTRDEMITEMVEIFGFTEEEATYGVDAYGIK